MKFSFRKKSDKRIGGLIEYYGLQDWWIEEFSESERSLIRDTFKPMMSTRLIDEGKIEESSQSKLAFLGVLASWFKKKETYNIAKKILAEGEKYVLSNEDVMDVHFFCLSAIQIFYANRDDDDMAFNKAVEYCKLQISLAPEVKEVFKKEYAYENLPMHTGYRQLAIIYEKQKEYGLALQLVREAMESGWNVDDCKKRIDRLEKKIQACS